MAISTPTAAQALKSAASASVVSDSFTPAANSELIVVGVGARSTAAASKPTISNTAGLTFTELGVATAGQFGGYAHIVVWRVSVGASPSSMTYTISSTSASRTGTWAYTFPQSEVSSGAWPAAIAQKTGGSSTAISPGPFGTDEAAIVFFASNQASDDLSDDSGYAELFETSGSTFSRYRTTFDASSPATSFTVSGQTNVMVAVALRVLPLLNLAGTRYVDPDTFGAGAVTRGVRALTGTLFANSGSFGSGVVAAGPATLTGTLFTDADSFGSGIASASYTVQGALYTNANSFGAGTVSPLTVTGTLFASTNAFGSGVVSTEYGITGTLYVDPDTFGSGSISASYTITGALFTDPDSFGQGVIAQPPPITAASPGTSIWVPSEQRTVFAMWQPRSSQAFPSRRDSSAGIEDRTLRLVAEVRTVSVPAEIRRVAA